MFRDSATITLKGFVEKAANSVGEHCYFYIFFTYMMQSIGTFQQLPNDIFLQTRNKNDTSSTFLKVMFIRVAVQFGRSFTNG